MVTGVPASVRKSLSDLKTHSNHNALFCNNLCAHFISWDLNGPLLNQPFARKARDVTVRTVPRFVKTLETNGSAGRWVGEVTSPTPRRPRPTRNLEPANQHLGDATMATKRTSRMNDEIHGAMAAVTLAATLAVATSTAQAHDRPDRRSSAGREAKISAALDERRTARLHAHAHDDNEQDDHHNQSQCVELAEMSIMFNATASEQAIVDLLEAMPEQQFAAALPQGSRWTTTATDGSVAEGESFTITYSFVPDGTPITITGTPGTEGSTLFANFDASFPGGRAAWKAKFAEALNRWGQIINVTYVEVADDGASFPASPGVLGLRGDVRIAMRTLGDAPLAVNFFPQFGGDMVMDSLDMADFVDATNNFRSLQNVLAHEHGHGLGLNHVVPSDGTKLMEPFLNTGFDGPQEDDIRGACFIYGDTLEANDTLQTNKFVGGTLNLPASVGVQVLAIEELALERAGASDFYGFTAFAGTPIAISVEPVGTTYPFASQSNPNNVTNIDAQAVRNLALRLWRRTSAQNNTFELFAQIDFNDAGEGEYHPPIPYSVAGFMVAEVYSEDGINDCQRYRMTISNSDIEPTVEPASMSVFNFATNQGVFDGTVVQFGQVDVGGSKNITLTIGNNGPGVLEIGDMTVTGPGAGDFNVLLFGNPIAAISTGSLLIAFNPTVPGVRQAIITVPNNDPTQPNFSFIVSGTAVEPLVPQLAMRIEGIDVPHDSVVDIGDVTVGELVELTVELTNTGNATLNVSSIAFLDAAAGDFATSLTQANLAPGASVAYTVTVTPSAPGLRNSRMRLFNNGVHNPFIARLEVNGVAPLAADCNANGTEDADDIAGGASQDCNANGTPDECEADTDGDGTIDACDLCPGDDDTLDTDGDGTPDCLELDQPLPEPPVDPIDPIGPIGGGLCGTGGGGAAMMAAMGLCGAGLRARHSTRRRRWTGAAS